MVSWLDCRPGRYSHFFGHQRSHDPSLVGNGKSSVDMDPVSDSDGGTDSLTALRVCIDFLHHSSLYRTALNRACCSDVAPDPTDRTWMKNDTTWSCSKRSQRALRSLLYSSVSEIGEFHT